MTASLLGGLGVFLMGMVLMTDGLKAVAGDALRRILTRYVATPLSGVGWGALVTALVQSSTATTLTTVGFVSAGLLTFTQAIGVIFGANLGTTSTGWIVSQLGFKVSLGSLSPPLVLLGVAMRLLFKGRATNAGTALAGFALLFMGIDMLQSGMGELAARLTPGDLPGGAGGSAWADRLILVGFGFLMTVIMQSSSASMTTTLAAVATGAIGIEQAAALAVGQNIGTTPTAVAASIGATTAARRTAAAHVLFNTLTALVAVVLLPGMLQVCRWLGELVGADDAPTTLALFHTVFNLLGVAILLPVIGPFSRLIERIFPERGQRSTRYLAASVARVGPVALEAARRALVQILADLAISVRASIGSPRDRTLQPIPLDQTSQGLTAVVRFVHDLGQSEQATSERTREQSLLHAADHLERAIALLQRMPDAARGTSPSSNDPVLLPAQRLVLELSESIAELCQEDGQGTSGASDPLDSIVPAAEQVSIEVAAFRKSQRAEAFRLTATGAIKPDTAMDRVDALLWIDGIAYHLWRAALHLRYEMAGGEATIDPDSAHADHPRPTDAPAAG